MCFETEKEERNFKAFLMFAFTIGILLAGVIIVGVGAFIKYLFF